jgi:U4/U6.U5 tri-snRNP-associated protein 2
MHPLPVHLSSRPPHPTPHTPDTAAARRPSQNLDFDFEKCCSVSLSRVNVYVCLVCGKNFSGRGPATHAYTHALEAGHHLFMNLDSGRAYCLPDMYEVQDRALADIQFVLNPTYTGEPRAGGGGGAAGGSWVERIFLCRFLDFFSRSRPITSLLLTIPPLTRPPALPPAAAEEDVARLDASSSWSRALDGTDYMPGLVGLNNMRANDYANAVLQALARLHPVRDFFLRPANYAGCASLVVQRFGELVRRVWNPRAFKGHVSPHELMQAVLAASARRFAIEAQGDPVEFFSWLANTLHADLTGGRRRRRSVITDCLQGEMRVTTLAGTGKARGSEADLEETLPFLMVALDLPPAPLFKDALEEVAIPQVPVFELLRKFDGARVHDDVRAGRRRFAIARLPPFLVLHAKRFLKNQFFVEKNPTIVNFPVKGLDLGACVALPPGAPRAMYDLVANVVHEGKAGEGSYRVHVQRRSEGVWYEVQDLRVGEVLPQVVALSEAYLQVWERRPEAEAPPARAGAP